MYIPFVSKVYTFFGPQGGTEGEQDSSFRVGSRSNYFLGLL